MNQLSTKTFIPFRPGEIKVFRKRKRLPGPQWAERNIHVPIGSRQGLYRNHNNPAMHGVLEWATRLYVRIIVMAKGIQIGGTLIFYSLMLREAEYSSDSALIVMADERSVKKLSKNRLQPMIDKSPTLATIKSGNPDDTTIYSITLGHGFTIDIGWASSEMSVSSESYRIVLLDEISKYKTRGNIEDAKSRTTVYQDTKKIFIWSSPGIDTDDPNTRDPLMVEAENCDVMLDYHAICPDCGHEQVMVWENFKWPGQTTLDGKVEADPKTIRRNRSAWYECSYCQSRWNDYKRDKAVLAAMIGGWKQTDAETIEFPQSVYFHFPSWLSPFVSLSDVVADWLEAQGDEEKLRKWYNRHAAISHRYDNKEKRQEDTILRLIDPHMPRAIVPRNINSLLILADTQQIGFYYEVVAFGWGRELENWVIDRGYVEQFEHLNLLAERDWFDADNNRHRCRVGFIDSGGGTDPNHPKHSRTREVYDFCIDNPFWSPLKGKQRQSIPVNWSRLDFYPGAEGKKVSIPGGLLLYTLDTTFYKNTVERKLLIDPGNPGACHLHAGLARDEMESWHGPHAPQVEGLARWQDYARQMCAEVKNERGLWECLKGRANHHFDLAVYRYAAADILMIGDERPEGVEQQPPVRMQKQERAQKTRRW